MWKRIFSKKRIGILLLLLFAGTSTGLVVTHTCHTPSENQSILTQTSHFHKDGLQHIHNVVTSAPKVLDSMAGELCVGLFLLVLLVGRKYQLNLRIFRDGYKKFNQEPINLVEKIRSQSFSILTLPKLGLLRI